MHAEWHAYENGAADPRHGQADPALRNESQALPRLWNDCYRMRLQATQWVE